MKWKIQTNTWPPNNQDITPMNLFMWRYLKNTVYTKIICNFVASTRESYHSSSNSHFGHASLHLNQQWILFGCLHSHKWYSHWDLNLERFPHFLKLNVIFIIFQRLINSEWMSLYNGSVMHEKPSHIWCYTKTSDLQSTWCGYEVPRITFLHDLEGAMWLDHSKDMSAHVSTCISYDFNVLMPVVWKLLRW
jgi:hypothetical protein